MIGFLRINRDGKFYIATTGKTLAAYYTIVTILYYIEPYSLRYLTALAAF